MAGVSRASAEPRPGPFGVCVNELIFRTPALRAMVSEYFKRTRLPSIAWIPMRQRSCYPKPFKAQVVLECLQPGATVSSVAISHGINANVIRKWMPLYRDQPAATSLPAFVPLKAAPKRPVEMSVIIELPMAWQVITVKWPASDPDGCAQFIRAVAQ